MADFPEKVGNFERDTTDWKEVLYKHKDERGLSVVCSYRGNITEENFENLINFLENFENYFKKIGMSIVVGNGGFPGLLAEWPRLYIIKDAIGSEEELVDFLTDRVGKTEKEEAKLDQLKDILTPSFHEKVRSSVMAVKL